MNLLRQLCAIRATSGNEVVMTSYLLNYIDREKKNWASKPTILFGDGLQDSIVLIFGKPKTAVFAHMDSIGYTVRYGNQLVRIGSPHNKEGDLLVGEDQKGNIECEFKLGKDGELTYDNIRPIETGTTLTYKPDFRETDDFVQCCYLDNRLGIYVALKLAETMENGAICFSCWEEHGGGSAENIGRILYEKYHLRQALICDITWVTEGVKHGKGVAISLRDSGIPRRSYVNRIIEIAKKHQIPYQLEVEGSGGSDGNSLQRSPFPLDWCFVGAPEDNVHTPNEIVHKNDIKAMIQLYTYLVREL